MWGVGGGSGHLDPNPNMEVTKMDNKTSIAVISALKYRLQNEDCKINLPKATYAKALRNSLIRLR